LISALHICHWLSTIAVAAESSTKETNPTIEKTKKNMKMLLTFVTLWGRMTVMIAMTVALAVAVTSQDSDTTTDAPPPVIAGYLPNYRFAMSHLSQALSGLTDVILFSVDPVQVVEETLLDGNCCLHRDEMDRVMQAVETAHNASQANNSTTSKLKVWLTLGGGGRSFGFGMGRSRTKRAALFAHILQTAHKYQLDGIDWDCESFAHAQDYQHYIVLLREAKHYFHDPSHYVHSPYTSTDPPRRLLQSVALHPKQTLPEDIYQTMDRIHLMAYDMIEPQVPYHADMELTQKAVEQLIASGAPPNRIVLGIPAYARHAQHPEQVKALYEVYDGMMMNDGEWKASLDEWEGYRFESGISAHRKLAYAQTQGLAGVFLWEMGQDKPTESAPEGILLSSLLHPPPLTDDDTQSSTVVDEEAEEL
jgi:GH18 family chitinase